MCSHQTHPLTHLFWRRKERQGHELGVLGRGSEGGSRAREGWACLGRVLLQSLDYRVHPGLIWGCSELMTLSVVESEVRRNRAALELSFL